MSEVPLKGLGTFRRPEKERAGWLGVIFFFFITLKPRVE